MSEQAKWTLREGYVLALAPALGLFCVNRYEAGRFAYLGIPTDFIDLSVTRLVAGGTAIVVFAALLFAFLRAARTFLLATSGWRRFVGAYALFFVLLGVPQLLQASTSNAFAWAFLLPLCLSVYGMEEHKDNPRPSSGPTGGDVVAFLIFSGLLSWIVFSFGFFAERTSGIRLCQFGSSGNFIAGFYGGKALVKEFDPKSKRMLPGVALVELSEGFKAEECKLSVIGMPGFTDQAFSRSQGRTLPR